MKEIEIEIDDCGRGIKDVFVVESVDIPKNIFFKNV
jgi:hypothetical protein